VTNAKPLRQLDFASTEYSTQVIKEVAGMETGKVLAVNSMARIEHVEIDSTDLNQGFEKFAQHLKQNGLSWPQLLASAFTAGKTRIMMSSDSESLDTLLRTLERSKDLRKQRETLSSVSLTCFGGVSSALPFKAIQILPAFRKFVCSCGEPRGRSQGFAFADLTNVRDAALEVAFWPDSDLRRCLLSRRCSRDQVVMRRMEGDADRGAAVGDIPVAEEMEGIRRLIGRVRFTAFRGRPVP